MGPVGVRVVTAHERRCDSWWFLSDEEERVYAVKILRCGSFHVITISLIRF